MLHSPIIKSVEVHNNNGKKWNFANFPIIPLSSFSSFLIIILTKNVKSKTIINKQKYFTLNENERFKIKKLDFFNKNQNLTKKN